MEHENLREKNSYWLTEKVLIIFDNISISIYIRTVFNQKSTSAAYLQTNVPKYMYLNVNKYIKLNKYK